MEHDVCTVPDGPADRFRIPPTLVADHDAKCQRTGLEDPPARTGRIDTVLRGVELDFVLETGNCSVSIDDQCGGQQGVIDDAFGAQNNREGCFGGGRRNGGPGAFEERRVWGWHGLPHSSVAGREAFRKADETGTLAGRLRDGLYGQRDRLLGSRREPDVGEGDSKHVRQVIQF